MSARSLLTDGTLTAAQTTEAATAEATGVGGTAEEAMKEGDAAIADKLHISSQLGASIYSPFPHQ